MNINGVFVPWKKIFGPLPPTQGAVSDKQREKVLGSVATRAQFAADIIGVATLAQQANMNPAFAIFQPYSLLGTFAVAGQGHHPIIDPFSRYLPPPRALGGPVRMSSRSQFGPWGGLKRVKEIVDDASKEFAKMGYSVIYKRINDQVLPGDLEQTPSGNPNIFNSANVGLFVGHSLAARDPQSGFIWRQAYVPIYNSVSDTMTFVGTSSMSFGSEQLKWMAFFSCNMFRDGLYRSDGIYDEMKNFFALPMNGYLHIMQGYATEVSMHPDLAFYWTLALQNSSLVSSPNHSVIGAWNYVCRNTQPPPSLNDPVNVARSLTWPECQADFIFGYGPQTEPNRDPLDPLEQEALIEIDHAANSPEP